MPGVFTLIGRAWTFFRTHPALGSVLLWLIFPPIGITSILVRLVSAPPPDGASTPWEGVLPSTKPVIALVVAASALLLIVGVWGNACVLAVGRRMIQNRSGRARTSFASLRREAAMLIVPLVVTNLLRMSFIIYRGLLALIPVMLLLLSQTQNFRLQDVPGILLRSLTVFGSLWGTDIVWTILTILLLLPAILYGVRTAFYDVIIATEREQYRAALSRSSFLVSGKTFTTLVTLALLLLIFFVPLQAVDMLIEKAVRTIDARFLPLGDLLSALVMAVVTMLYTLTTIDLFGSLRNRKQAGKEVMI